MHYIYDSINNYSDYNIELNKMDKDKVNLLINDKDKKLTILSRVLLDKLLNKYYNTNYKDVLIKYNKYNKPYIDNIYFNISHSNNYACVSVSDKNVGIDIEYIREVDINIINYFCTDKEINYILNSNDKYKSLFTLFCLKEAYFKMIGTGIKNMKDIYFDISNNISCNKDNLNIKIDYSIDNYVICIIEEKD